MTKTAILKEDLLQVFFLVNLSIQGNYKYSSYLYVIFNLLYLMKIVTYLVKVNDYFC